MTHPKPPSTLNRPAATAWRNIVREYPPAHFSAANLMLLEQLCQTLAHIRECDAAIKKHGLLLGDKANPAVAMRNLALSHFRSTATKLRLPISSTMRAEAAGAKSDPKHAEPKPWE